jgi:hypothetical protein
MYRVRAGEPTGESTTASGGGSGSHAAAERWSRTIGALGGFDVWRRLAGLSVTIVGCGRTGSMLAEALGRLGVDRLTLIDPDLIEPGNLGEMALVTGRDRGRPKAEAVGVRLARDRRFRAGWPRWLAVGLDHPAAIAAARACDVLACCVDDDAARLRAGLIAVSTTRCSSISASQSCPAEPMFCTLARRRVSPGATSGSSCPETVACSVEVD